jgi:hypothetical protein
MAIITYNGPGGILPLKPGGASSREGSKNQWFPAKTLRIPCKRKASSLFSM